MNTQLKRHASTALIFLGIFAFRSSLAEPYRVPSGSMLPTIVPGDFLMVSKAAYDLKLPFTDIVIWKTGQPARGDVVVFRYPRDPSINFVKRLIGVPGDVIETSQGSVWVNGQATTAPAARGHLAEAGLFSETLEGHPHRIRKEPGREGEYANQHFTFTVPPGQYFFMGDNRDESNDGRFWGFVPESALRGKARWVWLSVDWAKRYWPRLRWDRIGERI